MTHRIFLRSSFSLLLGLACASIAVAEPQRPTKPPSTFVLTHVTVIDCTGAEPKPDMTVVIRDHVIQALGKSKDVTPPPESTIIDAHGKFLIPGLWDMHVHCDDPWSANLRGPTSDRQELLPMFTARGVTGVRDMGCDQPQRLVKWRDEIAEGRLLAPNLILCGYLIDGPDSPWPNARECSTAEEGRQTVAKLKGRGADFIKVYTGLAPDVFLAVADESKKLGIPFAGRVPNSITNIEASNAGQASLELLLGMVRDCGDVEAAKAAVHDLDPETAPSDVIATYNRVLLETQSPEKERALVACLAKNKTWVTPVLIAAERVAFFDEEHSKMSDRIARCPAFLREAWKPDRSILVKDRTPASMETSQRMQARLAALVGALNKGGVRLLAGTDSGETPLCIPGESLHEELALLVQAGLTPAQALITATRNPAEFLGRADKVGTVEVGKDADLVLLTADPLADIRNVSKIESVVVHGRLMSKERLMESLAPEQPAPVEAATPK